MVMGVPVGLLVGCIHSSHPPTPSLLLLLHNDAIKTPGVVIVVGQTTVDPREGSGRRGG